MNDRENESLSGEVSAEIHRIKRLFEPTDGDKEDLISYATEIARLRASAQAKPSRDAIARVIPDHIFMDCGFDECNEAERKAFLRCADAVLALSSTSLCTPSKAAKCSYPKCECGDGFHVCPEATEGE